MNETHHVTSISYNSVALTRSAMLFTALGCTAFRLIAPLTRQTVLEVGVSGTLEIITPGDDQGPTVKTVWIGVRFEHIDTDGNFVFFGEASMSVTGAIV